MRISHRQRRGFSLIELVTVIVLIGIIAAIALPRYSAALCNYRASAAARRVRADLVYAQSLAKSSSTTCAVTFNATGNSYQITSGAVSTNNSAVSSVSLQADPFDSTLSLANQLSIWTVSFNGYGIPSSGGTIIVQCGTARQAVTIDPDNGVVGQ